MDYRTELTNNGFVFTGACGCGGVKTEKFKNTKIFPKLVVHIFPLIHKFSIIAIGNSQHKLPLSQLSSVLKTFYEAA